MKTVAIIQARMGSTRLPGKVLSDMSGMPVLAWVVRAARAALGVDEVWVATSVSAADDAIASWCGANTTMVFRGSESDVLDRFAGNAKASAADIVVRLTADCPLLDPAVLAQTIRLRSVTGADYASNVDPPTWPDGLDCEVLTSKALFAAAAEAVRPSDREHVTPFVRNNRHRFTAEALIAPLPGLAAERWTLDTPEDLALLQALAQELAKELPPDRAPSYLDVLAVLDRQPQLRDLNRKASRNSGFAKSVATEKLDLGRRFDRSQELIEGVERAIPVGSQTFSKSKLQFPPGAAPLFVTHGDGGRVFDIDGNEYVDLVGALLPNVLGYRDPDVDLAIRRQLTRGISFSLATTLEMELAERLIRHIPCAEMVRFGKNGTDATSAAVRLARAATGRDRLILLGYHGWQDWYIGATTRNLGVPAAVSALSHLAPYGDIAAIKALLGKFPGEFAAIVLEPMNTVEPAPGYLQDLKELAHRHGALLIFDEIITGFRWALGGAQARYGVTPDLACFGKAMGNGMPISAVVGRADIMRRMEDIFFSGTFGGETLSLAASIATIDKMERENVVDYLWETGAFLMAEVRARIKTAGLVDVIGLTGAPPWAILTYKDHARASKEAVKTLLLREMIAAGVLINASHNVGYAHGAADIAHVLKAYDHALGVVKEALDRDDLERRLGNQVIRPIFGPGCIVTKYDAREIRSLLDSGENIVGWIQSQEKADHISPTAILYSYDAQAGSYVEHLNTPGARDLRDRMGKSLGLLLQNLHPTSILEAGTGEGTSLAPILNHMDYRPAHVLGFDLSLSRLLFARKYLADSGWPNVDLFTGDLERIPLASGSVDAVVTIHAVEPNRGREEKILSELLRVAGRYLVMVEPSYELASADARARMDRLGYVRGLSETLSRLGFPPQKVERWPHNSNPLNEAALIVVEKSTKAIEAEPSFVSPVSGGRLIKRPDCWFCPEDGHAFPIVAGFPCLTIENAILASKLDAF